MYELTNTRIRSTTLNVEYARSGIPVIELSYSDWLKSLQELDRMKFSSSKDFMGMYYNNPNATKLGFPRRFIVINKSMPNYEKLMVFYHEVGHHSCVKCRCKCAWKGFQHRKTELHAELSCIYIAKSRGYSEMVLELVKETVEALDYHFEYNFWNASRMLKHPVYLEAVKSVEYDFNLWLKSKSNRRLKRLYDQCMNDSSIGTCRWKPSNYLVKFASKV
jgi:hypothetical protein